jgi:2-oxoglutarate ferredoxin oxidoreductase subunit alpha
LEVHLNVMVGGEAGQGVQSVGFILAKTLARGGYHVFADQDYESRVRGGHNFYRVRASTSGVAAISTEVDILLALNEESLDLHMRELAIPGVAVFDSEKVESTEDGRMFVIPLEKLAGGKIMANTVALGAALALIEYDLSILEEVVKEQFGTGEVGKNNIKAARAGYEYARENYKGDFRYRPGKTGSSKRMLVSGNEAIALGAIAAGCKFVSSYPMTPSTSIMEYMASRADEYGIVVIQPEDEISAINMIVGAGFAGVRAMTTTSGSGFCLMVEGLGLAGITETPIVMVDAQRPGPAVGLPTRTEQGDLQFMLTAHHGDFPRIILAPATIEDCFWLAVEAFNLAERYQLPVVILTDQHLASSYATVDRFDLSKVVIDRGELYSGAAEDYKRHAITRSGISPRAFPGQGKALVVTDSDEHDETGHLTEGAGMRTEIVSKRLRKLDKFSSRNVRPHTYGPAEADILLIGWGSTYGALREAADILKDEGSSVRLLHLGCFYPFPTEAVAKAMDRVKTVIVAEGNASGQLARLIRTETGREVDGKILKFDGRPFTPAYIVEKIRQEGV